MTELKHCRKCGCDKPADREHWTFTKTGRPKAPCKSCNAKRQQILRQGPAFRERAHDYARKYRQNPIYREQQREYKRRYRLDPKYCERERELQRARDRKRRLDPSEREREREYKRKVRQDPTKRERQREYMRDRNRDAVVRERKLEYSRKRRQDPKIKLDNRVRSSIHYSLKRVGLGKTTIKVKLLEWTIEELMVHLEVLFEEGMDWNNISEWQIDHIVPLSAVQYESETDPLFKSVWSLSNLAPLWATDNNEKLANLDWQLPDTYKNPKLRAMYDNRDLSLVTKDAA